MVIPALLPLVFLGYICARWYYRPPVGVMEINYPPPGSRSDSVPWLGKQYAAIPKDIRWRNYVLDDQRYYNEAKLSLIRKQMGQMITDSSYGIRVVYTDKTSFNDYIRMLNLETGENRHYRKKGKFLRMAIINDTAWIFNKEAIVYREEEPYESLSYG